MRLPSPEADLAWGFLGGSLTWLIVSVGRWQEASVSHCVNLSTELLECPHHMVTGFPQKVGVCKAEATVSTLRPGSHTPLSGQYLCWIHRPARVSEGRHMSVNSRRKCYCYISEAGAQVLPKHTGADVWPEALCSLSRLLGSVHTGKGKVF